MRERSCSCHCGVLTHGFLSSDLTFEGKHPGSRRPGLRGGHAGRVRQAHTPTRALSVAPGVLSPAQTDSPGIRRLWCAEVHSA